MTGDGAQALVDHLFRQQAGRLTATLARRLGARNIDLAEEAVQTALLRALQSWPHAGLPDSPEAWLFRAAHNAALDAVRKGRWTVQEKNDALERLACGSPAEPQAAIPDDELRLIFLSCHPEIPAESRVALSLKVACGFSAGEIARAFLAEESAVAQRIVRAKRLIRERELSLELPEGGDLGARLDSVLEVIYLLFNEGYAAHSGEDLIRLDLCSEALRLVRLLATSALAAPKVHALAALIALQAARLPSRIDAAGELILLENQDRSLWDHRLIALGFHHFALCMNGAHVTAYHTQAAIAATYARSRSLDDIDWPAILELYDQLLALTPTPVVALNRAVALSKVRGPAEALATIEPLAQQLGGYYLLDTVRGHLLFELGHRAEAAARFRAALSAKCSEPERRFLLRKLSECQ